MLEVVEVVVHPKQDLLTLTARPRMLAMLVVMAVMVLHHQLQARL
jgi:hypothetical protein